MSHSHFKKKRKLNCYRVNSVVATLDMPLPVDVNLDLLEIAIAAVIGVLLCLFMYIVTFSPRLDDVPEPDIVYKAIQETDGGGQAEITVLINSELVRRTTVRDSVHVIRPIGDNDDSVQLPAEEEGQGATGGRVL